MSTVSYNQVASEVMSFLHGNASSLPSDSELFQSFVKQSLIHLEWAIEAGNPKLRLDFLASSLLPMEIAAKGEFKFVFDVYHCENSDGVIANMQIMQTSGTFSAVVIKFSRDDLNIEGHPKKVKTDSGYFHMKHISSRLMSNNEINARYPELSVIKSKFQDAGAPIIYVLGPARQFPGLRSEDKLTVEWQKRCLGAFFEALENRFGNNFVIGTGGWSGQAEESIGVPRIAQIEASKRNKSTILTMPHCGKYDRHQDATFEIFCGDEWGDDASALTEICDAAIVFEPYGAWTEIEIQNLMLRDKPYVVLGRTEKDFSNSENPNFTSATVATNALLQQLRR